jgi:hypothetical protein
MRVGRLAIRGGFARIEVTLAVGKIGWHKRVASVSALFVQRRIPGDRPIF